jgi:hypothetical protein
MAGGRFILGVGAALVFASSNALADPTAADKETSRSLYAQGIAALEAHDYASAERACGGAHSLVRAPTSASCWARALEGLGRLVEARDAFLEAVRFPAAPDEPAVFTSAREASRVESEALARRIPSLTLVVSGPVAGAALQVTIDGRSVPSDTARLPRRTDPGAHAIVVAASGFEPATVDVQLVEGENRRLDIALRPTSVTSRVEPEVPAAPASTQAVTTDGTTPSGWWSRGTAHTLALVGGGLGFVGLGVGTAFGLEASTKKSHYQQHQVGGRCIDEQCVTISESAASAGNVSTISFVAGGVLAAAGLALWFTAPARGSEGSALAAVPVVGVQSLGAAFSGSW